MTKFTNQIPAGSYAEVPQSNKLRWVNLFREVDGSYTHESKKWKCKDFLNEIVRKYQGQDSSIYGYDAGSIRVNEEGVYLRMMHIDNPEMFAENVGSINSLPGYVQLELTPIDNNEFVLFIPKFYFESTWRISLLTYLIRVSNVAEKISDWADHPTKSIDNPFPTYYDKALKLGFNEPVKGYWYYAGKQYTNLKKPDTYVVHDCGVNSWMTACTKEGLV